MRFLTLDLERYGPFTDRRLTFRPDAKLHLIHGPNEAGKSSSLAAITDLLFGIERKSAYDFLHDGKELRVGATIESADRRRLTFRRRKGNKNTLVDASDIALPDGSLLPFIGGVSREVFCSAFGLDSIALRAGAEAMLSSDGDSGASLLAAASGLRGLPELLCTLEEKANEIFGVRAKKDRRFDQAMARFNEAQKAIHTLELRAAVWKERNDEIEGGAKRLSEIKAQQSANAAAQARLSRLKRAAPLVALIDGDLARLALLGNLPEMPAAFAERCRSGLESLTKAGEARELAARAHTSAVQKHSEISVDTALVTKGSAISVLFSDLGKFNKNQSDSVRIQAEGRGYRDTLGGLAIRLGLADADAVEKTQPPDSVQARLRSLIGEGRSLVGKLRGDSEILAKERKDFERIERQHTDQGSPSNPTPLRKQFAAVEPDLKQLEKRSDLQLAIRTEARSLQLAAGRLVPPVKDLDALAAAPLPGTETISRFRMELDVLDEEASGQRHRLNSALHISNEIERSLAQITAERAVPTAEAIAEKRRLRDEEWKRLRVTLVGGEEPPSGAALLDTIASFERYGSEADRLADDAAHDAERVAAHASENGRLKEERASKEDAEQELSGIEARRKKLMDSWTDKWNEVDVIPLPPSEMSTWLLTVNALLERRDKLETLRDHLSASDSAIRGIEPALKHLSIEMGIAIDHELGISNAVAQITEQLRTLGESWDKSRDLDTGMRACQNRMKEFSEAQSESKQLHEKWLECWSVALTGIGLTASATPDEAEAVLTAWKEVPSAIKEHDKCNQRVAGMNREIQQFELQVAELVKELAPELEKLPANIALMDLNDRLSKANTAEIRKTEAAKTLGEAARNIQAADKALRNAEEQVAALKAMLPDTFEISDYLTGAGKRDELVKTLEDQRGQLTAQGDGHKEEQLRAELATFDSDLAAGQLQDLKDEEGRLGQVSNEVYADWKQATDARKASELGMGAEVALQQKRNAEAELAAAAREWTVLKLGALLISNVVASHRSAQQNPLIARAGKLFELLTGGAFVRLGQDFDDQDVPHLVGHRNSGKQVSIAGMSDGTRDQLYLALRLAYLEDYASRAESVPFIGDDLFITFDDARTAHALTALAAIGDRVQPILFTHHAHVVEIARMHMGADVDVISLC